MDIKKTVSEILSKRVDVSSLKENDKLSALGLDSLDLVEVMLEIEDTLGIEFDSSEIQDVATLGDVRMGGGGALRTGSGVADSHDQRRHPRQAEFPFFQQLKTAREMAVLVEHYLIPPGGIGLALAIKDRTDIAELQPAPESDSETVLEGVIAPGGGGQGMLVQIVVGDHKRPVRLHLGRGHLQEPGTAVGKLGADGAGGQSGKQDD